MTIVDSINKLTSDLGGTPTGKNTIQEAIDELNPVLVSKTSGGGDDSSDGGSSFGTALIVIDPTIMDPTQTQYTVTLDGLSTGNGAQELLIEPVSVSVKYSYYDSRNDDTVEFFGFKDVWGTHGILNYDGFGYEYILFDKTYYSPADPSYDIPSSLEGGPVVYYRNLMNGSWEDWGYDATISSS